MIVFFFQAEDGIRDLVRSRGLGDVYKRQVLDNDFIVGLHQKNDPKKISELDFASIEEHFETAKNIIPDLFTDHSLYTYVIEFDYNKRAYRFTVNSLKVDENNHIEGNQLVTNYYEFEFELNEEGKVILLED